MKDRFVPIVNNQSFRLALGLALALVSPIVAARVLHAEAALWPIILATVVLCWLPAVYLADKYRHKYPQRYYSYLAAAHLKAAGVMAVAALVIWFILGSAAMPGKVLTLTVILIVIGDALISALRRRSVPRPIIESRESGLSVPSDRNGIGGENDPSSIDTVAALSQLDSLVPPPMEEFLRGNLPRADGDNGSVILLDDLPADGSATGIGKGALVIGRKSLNRVSRLNLFLKHCTNQLAMGGYVALRYTPLEEVYAQLRLRFPGLLYGPAFIAHFIWYRAIPKTPWLDKLYFSQQLSWIDRLARGDKRRNRVLSKAEAWGRLAFYGMEVVAEHAVGSERLILARRAEAPVRNRKPSYYAVVALEKVGLDGERIRLHKVRSMYPFSEFLQKAIFESHGLSTTGKFKNDFRITEYGKLFRRHWIDELPGLFDWMRGEIKLVGMRATSPHFLSLYPREFYELYIQIKPGLIPPIFDESTGGFAKIVEIEQDYLQRYIQAPVRTDMLYFWYTFRDIFLRKVRSH